MPPLLGLACLLTGVFSDPSKAALPEAAALASGCLGCHGSKGEGHGVFPSIQGLEPRLFLERLNQFEREIPTSVPMHRLSHAFTPDERRRLARYFYRSSAP